MTEFGIVREKPISRGSHVPIPGRVDPSPKILRPNYMYAQTV